MDTTSESLIRQVARGNIGLTVAQENVAASRRVLRNLAVSPAIGAPNGVAGPCAQRAPLRRALDAWIRENRSRPAGSALYQTYFVDRQGYRERIETGYLIAETGTPLGLRPAPQQ